MLRNWLHRYRQRHRRSPDPTALRTVYVTLFEVQRSHALIDVTVDGIEARYQSIILGIDPDLGTVTIDELFPRGFVGLPGQPVVVTVRLDGARRLSFATHIIERRREDGVELYQLMLPQALDYDQRRGAFRLSLGASLVVPSRFVGPGQQPCAATVRDLSSTGIRLAITEPAALCQGDMLDDLRFEFAGRSFRCRADVRNVDVENGTVGAAFVDLPRPEQRALERIIAQLQRQRAQQFAGAFG